MITIETIVIEYLKSNGYDGLYNEADECGCRLDDLAPCDGVQGTCKPGYLCQCQGVLHEDYDYGWHIVAEKPKEAEGCQ